MVARGDRMLARPSRRGLLLGAVGMLAAGCADDGSTADGTPVDDRSADRLVTGSFASPRMGGRKIGWSLAYPLGHEDQALPVVISLHGRRSTHRSTFGSLGLGEVLDRVVADGTPPFALASVDGGENSYWHARTDGTDAAAMVREEFVPLLRRRRLETRRLGLYGWSMDGYGALLLAGQGMRVRAVAASTPALFTAAGSTATGAFDSAADFERHDVFGNPEWLRGVPVRLDCGRSDPFYDATRDFADRMAPGVETSFPDGEHDVSYWHTAAAGAFRFLGERLA